MGVSLYELLSVPQSASIQEIRRAYYRLAKHWHPDVNSSNSAKSHFQEVNNAYRILSDPIARKAYDEKLSDPWVSNQRKDYYRYGTSVRKAPTPGAAPHQRTSKNDVVKSPVLDKVLFGSLLLIGAIGILYGIVDIINTKEDETFKPTGLLMGVFFTIMLLVGWRVIRKEA